MAGASRSQGSVALDVLELTIVADNELDVLSSVDENIPLVRELGRRMALAPVQSLGGQDCKAAPFDDLCCACHGLSVLLSGSSAGERRSLLFDVGPDAAIWLANARRLGVELAPIEGVVLSHWHFDHSGALPGVLGAIAQARAAAGLEPPFVDVHPDRPERRGTLTPSGIMAALPEDPTLEALARAGARVLPRADAHTLADGFFFVSGGIERVTGYETGLFGHHSMRDGWWEPDAAILDERFVAAMVSGRGATLLSACSHAGIVNACLAAQAELGGAALDLVLGGFHLAGKTMETRIEPTVRDLAARISPRLLAPGHCTGWRAKAALAQVFGAGRLAPSGVGNTYRLQAKAA